VNQLPCPRRWPNPRVLAVLLILLAPCQAETVFLPLTVAGQAFRVELALTPAARAQGLMYRDAIGPDEGMLFVYPTAQPIDFYMKNCRTEIDVAFLDAEARVVSMHEMRVEPPRRAEETDADYTSRLPRYPSVRPALFALEVRGGRLREMGVRVGDPVGFPRDRLIPLAR